jgi:flagellar biosynthesis GTPase FlhF
MNNIRRFTAQNAKQALEEVHNALGPDAVVVNIRKAARGGIQGLFQSPEVEVSALVPAAKGAAVHQTQPEVPLEKTPQNGHPELPPQRTSEAGLGSHLNLLDDTPIEIPKPSSPHDDRIVSFSPQVESTEPWKAEQVLERIGILPLCIERLSRLAKRRFPQFENASVSDQLARIRFCLLDLWSGLYAEAKRGTRPRKLLVGPPGCGKTTTLCKWMTQTVLAKREPARVWRLDGHLANTAEMLTVHAEMLDVPVARVWKVEEYVDSTTQFIDLPGVTPSDAEGMKSLVTLANGVQPAECLLVLNSAYELNHLIGLVRSFSDIPINGLIMTHLDEETRWSKLWNLSLAVDMPILYWSGGQEMPGDFVETTPDDLFCAVMKHIKPHATQQTETDALNRFTIS